MPEISIITKQVRLQGTGQMKNRWLIIFTAVHSAFCSASYADDQTFTDISKASKCVGQVVCSNDAYTSTGTGFLCDVHSGIFTNAHVIAGSKQIVFIPEMTGTPINVDLVAAWPELDLALLKPSTESEAQVIADMKPAQLATAEPTPGETVVSVGYPRGLGYSITQGIASGIRVFGELPAEFSTGLDRSPQSRWIQTDCAINPGNSGGPLFNRDLQIVGINTWASTVDHDIYFALSCLDISQAIEVNPNGTLEKTDQGSSGDGQTFAEALASTSVIKKLDYQPDDEAAYGFLQLATSPSTEISINGVLLGDTSPACETLLIGPLETEVDHVLKVTRSGYIPKYLEFAIPHSGLKKVRIAVNSPIPTHLTLTAFPGNSIATFEGPITGSKVLTGGSTDLTDLPPGDYKVRVSSGSSHLTTEFELHQGSPLVVISNFIDNTIEIIPSRPTPAVLLPLDLSVASRGLSTNHAIGQGHFFYWPVIEHWPFEEHTNVAWRGQEWGRVSYYRQDGLVWFDPIVFSYVYSHLAVAVHNRKAPIVISTVWKDGKFLYATTKSTSSSLIDRFICRRLNADSHNLFSGNSRTKHHGWVDIWMPNWSSRPLAVFDFVLTSDAPTPF